MGAVALSGADTITLNNYVFVDLADGNCVELTFPSDIANVKTGKNGNSIFALNESGRQAEVKIRVLRGSADDIQLNSWLSAQNQNFSGTVLLTGQFIKKIGDGLGNITNDTYSLSGGVFTKQVMGKTNTEGETDQSISEYMIKFTNAPRTLSS